MKVRVAEFLFGFSKQADFCMVELPGGVQRKGKERQYTP